MKRAVLSIFRSKNRFVFEVSTWLLVPGEHCGKVVGHVQMKDLEEKRCFGVTKGGQVTQKRNGEIFLRLGSTRINW